MRIEAREVVLKDGRKVILRSPRKEDAQSIVDCIIQTAGETHFLANYPEELEQRFTLEKEEGVIQEQLDSPDSFCIVAFDGDRAVGTCGLAGVAKKIKYRHRAGIGVAIIQEYCGAGLGRMMMEYNLENASRLGYEIIELDAYADNTKALELYKKLGFQYLATRPRGFRLKDGTYRDEVLMYKMIK